MGKLLEGGSRTCRQSFRRSYSFCCSSAGEQCGRSWAVVDYVIEQDMDRGYFLSWEWPGASTIELAELRQPRSEGGWNEMTFFRNNGKWLVIALIALLLYRFFSDSHTSHPQSIGSSPLVSQEAKDPVMTCMIQRNTTVPTLKSKFFTAAPQQEGVLIQVLEGELPLAKDNHTVGQLHLDKLRPAFADRVLIEVSFDIDVPEQDSEKDEDAWGSNGFQLLVEGKQRPFSLTFACRSMVWPAERDSRRCALTIDKWSLSQHEMVSFCEGKPVEPFTFCSRYTALWEGQAWKSYFG